MPIGVTLADLRRDLRAETGQSLSLAQGVQSQETFDIMLDRQQRELWGAWEWPHLSYFVDVPIAASQSLYSYPASMLFDQINRIHISDGVSNWKTLLYGIKSWEIPAAGAPQGTPCKWKNQITVDTAGVTNPTGQIMLLPTPLGDGVMRLDGQAPVTKLSSDTDRCLIDSKAIVLFTAAEILAINKSEAAPFKLTKAQNYLRRLLQDSGADKRTDYNMVGPGHRVDHFAAQPYSHYRAGIDYVS